jgi:hypothetical protein
MWHNYHIKRDNNRFFGAIRLSYPKRFKIRKVLSAFFLLCKPSHNVIGHFALVDFTNVTAGTGLSIKWPAEFYFELVLNSSFNQQRF